MTRRILVLCALLGSLGTLALVELARAQSMPVASPTPALVEVAIPRSPYATTPALLRLGRSTYAERCADCHGAGGQGDGPDARYLSPAPRDLTEGEYMFRTTESGALPTDWDIYRTLRRGLPGTSMPGWSGLPDRTTWALVAFLKSLSPRFTEEEPGVPLVIPSAPAPTDASVARGREVYARMQCGICHGSGGRGDGRAAATLTDNHGRRVYAFDFTRGWKMKGGSAPEDIYRTFHTGIDGTPMPSYHDAITESESWDLVYYTRSLFVR